MTCNPAGGWEFLRWRNQLLAVLCHRHPGALPQAGRGAPMRRLRAWAWRLADPFLRKRRERELAEEIESHLQSHIEDNLRAGMAPEEARRAARLKLGGLESLKESYRDQRGIPSAATETGSTRAMQRRVCRPGRRSRPQGWCKSPPDGSRRGRARDRGRVSRSEALAEGGPGFRSPRSAPAEKFRPPRRSPSSDFSKVRQQGGTTGGR